MYVLVYVSGAYVPCVHVHVSCVYAPHSLGSGGILDLVTLLSLLSLSRSLSLARLALVTPELLLSSAFGVWGLGFMVWGPESSPRLSCGN